MCAFDWRLLYKLFFHDQILVSKIWRLSEIFSGKILQDLKKSYLLGVSKRKLFINGTVVTNRQISFMKFKK